MTYQLHWFQISLDVSCHFLWFWDCQNLERELSDAKWELQGRQFIVEPAHVTSVLDENCTLLGYYTVSSGDFLPV